MIASAFSKKHRIAAVIPALNEEETIGAVLDAVRTRVDDIVLVDDGSTDRTAQIARKRGVAVVQHSTNLGYDSSIDDGFREAVRRGADIILTFDADGQHDAADIPVVVDPIVRGEADVVVGRRPYRERIAGHLFTIVSRLKAGIDDPLCGLKAYRSDVYRAVGHFDSRQSVGTELMFTAWRRGYRIAQRDIRLNRRADSPRFGCMFSANWKILKAIVKALPL